MILSWLAPLIVFGLIVAIHELGHLWAARWVGVYAPRFALGFGPTLFRWRRGETEYVVNAFPVGGYVRMASREDEAQALLEGGGETPAARAEAGKYWDPEGIAPFGPKPVPSDRWFESKPVGGRVFILLAGVIANVLLAWGASVAMFAVNGRPYVPAVVDSVVADRPAARVGFQRGDSVMRINGAPVKDWGSMLERVSASAGAPLAFVVLRGGQEVTLTVTPETQAVTDPATGTAAKAGRIGLGPANRVVRESLGIGGSLAAGAELTWTMATSIVKVVRGLVAGDVSVKNLGGPVRIAQVSVVAAQNGVEALVGLIAFLSINLAVLNLLPIPVLDGGQVLITVAEGIKGSPFSLRTRGLLGYAGIAIVLGLFLTITWNDVWALIGR
ncbi:MAG: RIP metalloprotease RseP [Gemmatimonadaceae bacterium]|nr:RIP metalloprotease RseP [Gemmatimonadaceae bacterium]